MAREKDDSIHRKIVKVATELFYQNGYKATGVNEVIEKSGVAKATFYSHFPSKQDLCVAYVKNLAATDWGNMESVLCKVTSPRKRLLTMVETLEDWLKGNNYKGCGFLNLIPEFTDKNNPIRKESMAHYQMMQSFAENTLIAIKKEDPKKYKTMDTKQKAKEFMIIFTGAVALSEIYSDTWPVKTAVRQIQEMLS